MREDLFVQAGIVCPRCRRPESGRMIQAPLGIRDASRWEGEFLLEGLLGCTDPVCGAAYPVVDGVPVILKDVGTWWRRAKAAMSEARAVGPEVRGYFEALEGSGPEGIDGRSLLGSYMDFHFGQFTCDSAAPDPSNGASNSAYWEKVVGMARPGAGGEYSKSVDLGCSVGRFTFEAARFSGLSVGLDLDFGKVSAAAGIQRKRIVAYERRDRGRTFRPIEGMYDPPRNVLFLVGDALDPPFPGDSFDLVGALNLLDNVGVPLTLLGQADALLRAGGLLVLGTPYEWRAEIADPAEWLETDALDAAALLRGILEGTAADRLGFRYSVEGEIGGLPWTLPGHSRRRTIFLSHVMRARKNGAPGREAA